MIELEIPGFGEVKLEHRATDFTGTLSVDGKLLPGVRERLNRIAELLKVHVLTADTFGSAGKELRGTACELHIIKGGREDLQKEKYVKNLGAEKVATIGNGNNDRRMLRAVRLGIAVCLDEGCAADAVNSAQVIVTSPICALDLLLNPRRLKATLRF